MNIFIRTSIAPYRIDLYNALHREGFRMCFYRRVATDQAFDPDWIESLCCFRPDYLDGVDLGGPTRKFCRGIFRRIREEKPDVVIVPEFQLVLFQVLLARLFSRKKFRVISMCDDSLDMIVGGRDFSRLHRWLRGWVPRLVDDIITVTPQVRDWYRARFGKGLWMPIIRDEKKMRESLEDALPASQAFVERYGLAGHRVLLFVGRLVSIKNVDLLLDAFGKCGVEDAVLVIVGEGPEMESLQNQALYMGDRVIFTGRLEGRELYAWYNIAGVLALLSNLEPFGAVVNEALLGGADVWVSGRAGAACLVDEKNGKVTDIEDRDALPGELESLLMASEPVPIRVGLRPDKMSFSFDNKCKELIEGLK